jgi:hypothetical protein
VVSSGGENEAMASGGKSGGEGDPRIQARAEHVGSGGGDVRNEEMQVVGRVARGRWHGQRGVARVPRRTAMGLMSCRAKCEAETPDEIGTGIEHEDEDGGEELG